MSRVSISSAYLARQMTEFQTKLFNKVGSDEVRKNMNEIILQVLQPYVPYNSSIYLSRNPTDYSGKLRESGKATAEGITWQTPYARYVWNGDGYGPHIPIHEKGSKEIIGFYSPEKQYPNGKRLSYSTEGTGSHWVMLMLTQQKGPMNIRVTNYLKRECKNL